MLTEKAVSAFKESFEGCREIDLEGGEKLTVYFVFEANASTGTGKNRPLQYSANTLKCSAPAQVRCVWEGVKCPCTCVRLFAAGPVAKHGRTVKGLRRPCILHPSTVQRLIGSPDRPRCSFIARFSVPDQFTLYQNTE